MSLKLAGPVLALFIALWCVSGCATVQVHQKERLSDRIMAFDSGGTEAELRDHMISPREAASGGFNSANAGGCSCK